MYTSTVGQRLVEIYNERQGTDHNAKSFFSQVFHPLFYDSNRYLMWATNSPFVQGFSVRKEWSDEKRQEALLTLQEKIEKGDRDASVALGYPASEDKGYATTSGQVTNLTYSISPNDAYASWLGAALGVGVGNGYVLLINHEQIIWDTFKGWQDYYRKLNDPTLDKLLPYKVNSWNGHWLYYQYTDRRARSSPTLSDLSIGLDEKAGAYNTAPISWPRLLFAYSKQLPESNQLLVSVFGISKTNKTAGFFPMHLQSGRRLIDVYQRLFGRDQYLREAKTFETLYGRHIKRACELGSLGLQALRPKGLEKYLKEPKRRYRLNPDDNASLSQFFIYKTWIIAMLNKNKEDVSDMARDFAKVLKDYRSQTTKTTHRNQIENDLLSATTPKYFLQILADITAKADEPLLPGLNKLRDQVHFASIQDFRYFVTLLKFDYTYLERVGNTDQNS